jgi:hypothetical protein
MLCKSVDCWQASLLITNYKRSSCIHKFAIDVDIYINNLTYIWGSTWVLQKCVTELNPSQVTNWIPGRRWQNEFLVVTGTREACPCPTSAQFATALLWGMRHQKLKKKGKKKQPLVASVDSVCRSLNPKCQAPISVGSQWLPWLVIVSCSLTSKPTKKYKYISSFAKRVSNSQIKQYHDNREVLPNSPCTDLHLLLWYQLTANTEPIYGWSQPFEGTEHWRFHW